jgi:Family of unknown function (DUF6279)
MRVPLPAAITTTSIAVMLYTPLDARIIRQHLEKIWLHRCLRPVCTAWLVGMAMGLSGCSFLETTYNQAPFLLQWWLDGQLDLNSNQKQQVKGELIALQAWHRNTQLPQIARSLQSLSEGATQALSPTQACSFEEEVLQSLPALAQEASGHLARLALSLKPEQWAHMRREQDKSDQKWRKQWLDGSPAQRLERRVDMALEYLQDYYGLLEVEQKRALLRYLQTSPYDPDIAWQERQRRHADVLDTLQRISTQQPGLATAQEWLFQMYLRMLQPPVQALRVHQDKNLRFLCEGVSHMHGLMSADQRQRARQKLQGMHQALVRLIQDP